MSRFDEWPNWAFAVSGQAVIAALEVAMLQAAGVGEFDEQVYRSMLRKPSATLADLASTHQCANSRIRSAVLRLEELGLVKRTPQRRFAPADPEAAIITLIHRREAELSAVRGDVMELADEFRTGRLETHSSGLIEVITSADAIARRVRELNYEVQEEILVFDKPPYMFEPVGEVDAEQPLLQRGVVARAIYSQEAFSLPRRVGNLERLAAMGEVSRVLPELPFKLRIYDRRIAVLPLTSNRHSTEGITVVYQSGMLTALLVLFEAYWERAYPIAGGATERPAELTDDDVTVLRMLSTGLKDEAIARQLGVSMRTLRRRVLRVMDLLQASTRFQAGAQAMRLGWI